MRTFICATVIVAVLAAGCDGRDSRDGLLRDADGNAYVLRDMLDGRTWMTDNLNFARHMKSSLTYVTGEHALKFGAEVRLPYHDPAWIRTPGNVSYVLLNGRPNSVTFHPERSSAGNSFVRTSACTFRIAGPCST